MQLDGHPKSVGTLEVCITVVIQILLNVTKTMAIVPESHSTAGRPVAPIIVVELVKNIIAMAILSPAPGTTEGLQNGPASNRFARELAQRQSISKLMLYDFGPGRNVAVGKQPARSHRRPQLQTPTYS